MPPGCNLFRCLNGEQAVPDVAEDKFVIHVTRPADEELKNVVKVNQVSVSGPTRDVEVGDDSL